MIALIGDIHGDFMWLQDIVSKIPADAVIVQVGDFGFWPNLRNSYMKWYGNNAKRIVSFIDGNHDHSVAVKGCDWPWAHYIPRGVVRNIDGRNVLFLGGANSVDRKFRPYRLGEHCWFDEEEVSEQDVERALRECADKQIDLMITHSPPDWMIRKHFSPHGLRMFDIDPRTWVDHSALRIERVWRELGEPQLFSGHMHRSIQDGNCHILNINEVALLHD